MSLRQAYKDVVKHEIRCTVFELTEGQIETLAESIYQDMPFLKEIGRAVYESLEYHAEELGIELKEEV